LELPFEISLYRIYLPKINIIEIKSKNIEDLFFSKTYNEKKKQYKISYEAKLRSGETKAFLSLNNCEEEDFEEAEELLEFIKKALWL